VSYTGSEMAEATTFYGYKTADGKTVGLARTRKDDEAKTFFAERCAPGGEWVDAPDVLDDLMNTDRPVEITPAEAAATARELTKLTAPKAA
jgi:hypothetical protein